MKRTKQITTWGLLATLAATMLTPVLADGSSRQNNKNTWRNLGIAGAVIAGYGLLKGDQNATVLGALGGAYAADRYETDRQHQSQNNSDDNYDSNNRHYHRTNGWQPPVVNHNDYRDNTGSDYQNHHDNDNRDQDRYDGRTRQ